MLAEGHQRQVLLFRLSEHALAVHIWQVMNTMVTKYLVMMDHNHNWHIVLATTRSVKRGLQVIQEQFEVLCHLMLHCLVQHPSVFHVVLPPMTDVPDKL